MADTAVAITAGTGTNIDTRTEATNGNHRQVVVIGDPATNAGVAPVDATAGLKVDLGADNDVTVTGTVDLGATDNAVLDAIAASVAAVDVDATTIIGHVDGIETLLGTIDADTSNLSTKIDTIAGDTTSIQTAVELLDDTVATDGSATPTKGILIAGQDGTNAQTVKTDSDGNLQIDVLTMPTTTVTGTVAVTNAGITTIAGAVSGTEMQVDVLTMPTTTVTATNLDIRDLVAASDAVTIHGDVGVIDQLDLTNSNPVTVALVDGDGTHITSIGGGTQYTEDAAAAANPVGTALNLIRADALAGVTTTDGDNLAARGTDKGELYVKHVDSIAVTNAGITTIAGAVSGTEMQVDVLTSALPSGAATLTEQQSQTTHLATIAGDTTAIETATQLIDDMIYVDDADWTDSTSKHALVGGLYQSTPQTVTDGDVAPFNITANGALHVSDAGGSLTVDGTVAVTNADITSIKTAVEILDNAISGTEMQVDVVAALPAGTNAIGKLAANSGVDIGDVDVTSLPALAAGTNAIGKVIPPDYDTTSHTAKADKYYTNAGAVTDGIIWSPAAGKRWHVTLLYINVSAAATVTIEDDLAGGDVVRWKGELAANSGVVLPYGDLYPMTSGEDAADLIITTSAGNVYVQAIGYEI